MLVCAATRSQRLAIADDVIVNDGARTRCPPRWRYWIMRIGHWPRPRKQRQPNPAKAQVSRHQILAPMKLIQPATAR